MILTQKKRKQELLTDKELEDINDQKKAQNLKNKFRIFVRSDGIKKQVTNIKLPRIKTTPGQHMQIKRTHSTKNFENSGYLSMFEECTKMTHKSGLNSALKLNNEYLHFIFIPTTIKEVKIKDNTVEEMPKKHDDRTPLLISTSGVTKCLKLNMEEGEFIKDTSKSIIIDEHLFCGDWPNDTKEFVIKLGVNSSKTLKNIFEKYETPAEVYVQLEKLITKSVIPENIAEEKLQNTGEPTEKNTVDSDKMDTSDSEEDSPKETNLII